MNKGKLFLIFAPIIPTFAMFCGSCSSFGPQFHPYVYDLPCIYIATENNTPITTKEYYINCDVNIKNTSEQYRLSNEPGKIRGRGNSTWTFPDKKPYKLKFDKKIPLFGNKEAKTWVLLANHYDTSLIRNYLALSVGSLFTTQIYTSSSEFVDLYVNNDYRGVYQVCDQVEVKKNRVDIETPYGEPNNTSYLIELDDYAPEEGTIDIDYVTVNGGNYSLKFPETDSSEYDPKYAAYLKEYLITCFTALDSNVWSNVNDLIDVQTFADSYVINELFKPGDVYKKSFYVYINKKDGNGKLS